MNREGKSTLVSADGQESTCPEVWNGDAQAWISIYPEAFKDEFTDKPHAQSAEDS